MPGICPVLRLSAPREIKNKTKKNRKANSVRELRDWPAHIQLAMRNAGHTQEKDSQRKRRRMSNEHTVAGRYDKIHKIAIHSHTHTHTKYEYSVAEA